MAKAKPKKAAVTKQTESAVPEMSAEQLAKAANVPAGFKAKRVLTLPVVTIKKKGESRVLTINDGIRISKVEGKLDKETGVREKPAKICTVTDAITGEMGTFLVPAVIQSNLEKEYCELILDKDGKVTGVVPGTEKYVGLTFHMANLGKRKDTQRYNDFSLSEVEAS